MGVERDELAWILTVNKNEPEDYADLIAVGKKTIEVRNWSTAHRGLLIIAKGGKKRQLALAVVKLVDCRPMTMEDINEACLQSYVRKHGVTSTDGFFSWVLQDNIRIAKPFEVNLCGQLSQIGISREQCPEYFRMLGK